ncbi:B3 domain-containing protein REM20-like isoform X1 [Cornus florida]|uniref:B3 domain-containing protein REM20-like isoform X1 n=1 Tax=Cornus florida TaxID=4283 RepID=UPI002898131B|nr:B3 domain-containing protein REM20-like isoform X1 [Cornus florida]
MEPTESSLEFFKVFLPANSSQRLLIPLGFTAHLKEMIPSKALLRNCDGNCWPVEVKFFGNDHLFFEDGWVKFVEDNSLELGDFLVFQYNGNCVFDFSLYGRNSCEKKVKKASHSRLKEEETELEEEEDESLMDEDEEEQEEEEVEEDHDEEEIISRGTSNSGNAAVNVGDEHRGRAVVEGEDDYIFETGHYVRPKNPYFVAKMKQTTRKNDLLVPADVIKDNNLKLPSEIVLRDQDGKTWTAKLVVWSDRRTWIRGWKAVCRWHNLRENDRCICQFLLGRDGDCTSLQIQVVPAGSWLPK